jgi:hypothetical protein
VDGSYAFPGATVGSYRLHTSRAGVVGSASATGTVDRGGPLIAVPLVVNLQRLSLI